MASASELEEAGNESYQNEHMAQLFDEGLSFSGFERDALFWSRGDGTYLDISGVSGLDSISDGRGMAYGDLDNDGDADVVTVPVQEAGRFVFRNNVGQDNAFVRVSLRGTRSAPDAFGAVVRLESPGVVQTKINAGGSGFLSSNDRRLLFGLGADPEPQYDLAVVWPSGLEESFVVRPRESVLLVEGEGLTRVRDETTTLPGALSTSERIFSSLALHRGDKLPALSLAAVSGESDVVFARPGRRMLVNIWATWCVPCAIEMPELQRLHARLAEAGIDLIGISVDTAVDRVAPYLADKGIDYPNYVLAEEDFSKIFPGDALTVPLTLILDETGAVTHALSGWSAETRARIESLLP